MSASEFPCDLDSKTFHLGGYLDLKLVGIATFHPENLPSEISFRDRGQRPYRLRGMAVDPDIHRRGIGRHLLAAGETVLQDLGCDLLWFNARENAFQFYESLGYSFSSEIFDIPGVGPHKVMLKKLIF